MLANNTTGGNNTSNGLSLIYALQTIVSNNFSGSGNSLYVRIVCNSGANYEAFALDTILLTGTTDSATPEVTFDTDTSSITERDTTFNISIPVTVSNYDGNQIDVSLALSGTAEVTDFTLNTTSLSFTADGSQNISLDINNDADSDDETIILTITETSAVSGLIISNAAHTLTIIDDKTAAGHLYSAEFSTDDNGFDDHSTASPPADGPASAGPFGISPNQWSLSYTDAPSTDSGGNVFKVSGNALITTDWEGEAIFKSATIDVSGLSSINISAIGETLGSAVQNSGSEFFKYYYILDEGSAIETDIPLSGDSAGTEVNYSVTSLDVSSASSLVIGFSFNANGSGDGYSISSFSVTYSSPSVTTITWDGSDSSDWATGANWDTNTVPTATDNVMIPNVVTAPIIGATTGAVANDLTIAESEGIHITAGGSLIVSGTSSGDITYNVIVADDKWHLVSSPIAGEGYGDTWADDNSIAHGSGTNRGISTYQNITTDPNTGPWVYMQDTESSIFGSGKGYSLKRTNAGTLSFTGTYPGGPINPAISKNLSTWNLIGNPYPSYINIGRFIAENTIANNNLATAFTAIYVWDPTSGVTGAYIDKTTGYIHPGQAFFVYANVNGTASITETMQSHEPDTFYKTSNTTIHLILSNGTSSKKTKINYLNGKTTGLDAGFDIGMFDGVNSVIKIYTHLIENNEGIAFARQALPNSDLEPLVVPIGVEATINTELTFSAEALNIPVNIKVFLEDRLTNTFTRLDEDNANYKVTLTETLNGIGRFYLQRFWVQRSHSDMS